MAANQDQLLYRLGFVEGLLDALISTAAHPNNLATTRSVAEQTLNDLERVRNSCSLHPPETDQK